MNYTIICACACSTLVILAVQYILRGTKRVSAHLFPAFCVDCIIPILTGQVLLVSLVDWLPSVLIYISGWTIDFWQLWPIQEGSKLGWFIRSGFTQAVNLNFVIGQSVLPVASYLFECVGCTNWSVISPTDNSSITAIFHFNLGLLSWPCLPPLFLIIASSCAMEFS